MGGFLQIFTHWDNFRCLLDCSQTHPSMRIHMWVLMRSVRRWLIFTSFFFFDTFFPQRKAHKGAHLGPCYKKSVCPCSKSHCEFTKIWELGFVSRPLDLFLQFGDISDNHLVCVIGIFPILWVKPVLNTSLRFRKNGCHFSIIP